ncbi:MAG TPA: Bax inhibitor-1/YccA family protein [Thermoanaerobaculia bacterium]|nr:Bax inhibitor-1/YccA family protein [Thermoanaerobaculia bacterium]
MERFESQQPAWISAGVDTIARERAFFRSVYAWMFGGLLLTALASFWVVVSQPMQQLIFGNRAMIWVLFFAELGLVFFLSAAIQRISAGAAAAAFLVFSLLNGLSLSAIFFVYTHASIVQAFVSAAAMFGAMSIYGFVTRRDLTSWGSFFFMGLIGIVICSIVNIFLRSGGLSFVISVVGVFVFLGLTAWDTQKLKHYAQVEGGMRENLAIIGALALYLDFINLFILLLRLFGGRRD